MRGTLIGLLLVAACGDPATLPTVPGPEDTSLTHALRGTIVSPGRANDGILSEIRVLSLPDRHETVIRPKTLNNSRIVAAVAGPDAEGRIAFLHSGVTRDDPELAVIAGDGSREKSVMRFGGRAGSRIALSRTGGRVAAIGKLRGRQMPGAYFEEGDLTVIDLADTGAILRVVSGALDQGLSWFPDGRRLAFVALRHPSGFGTDSAVGEAKDRTVRPTVVVLDVVTGESREACAGVDPVISADGTRIIVRESGSGFKVLELEKRVLRPASWPGEWGRVVALGPGDLIVFHGLPTEGAQTARSPYGSFRAGIQTPPIKVAEITTGRHASLIPAFDPRHDISAVIGD